MKKILMTLISLLLIILAAIFIPRSYAYGYEYRLNLGLWTEHYINDKSIYNENSHFYQFTVVKNNYFLTTGSFRNSYKNRSKFIGWGMEFKPEGIDYLTFGYYIASIGGYQKHRSTHYKGLLFLPIQYVKYKQVVLTVMLSAVNFGYEIKY